ncbi:molecular chaperone DnaJ [Haloarcula taiwanensis]|uniref:Molecular chaperone DnaJ n=1 Tax=Haloarcula taiwanensis TaxID=1932004 RepID=A0A2H4ZWV5_9EURY|nr:MULTISPECIES: DnaJ domain-containing protein [Haloarcula]AUG46971.1 molecular chaperone DnaJ [Haloarcula taiwanensis]RLM37173.1 molecular chaperone DnaJ [Haloarcula sp. Atlit-120R]RLM44438.1 molecular chaperone DnaJ [Haloarcula sp. Atlit-47R]
MEATFYGILGVDPDATEETIVRAYREQTKTHHPDVSDDPAARDRFKRLTQAKDVLTDEAERARYDRLGHDAYVNRHVDSVADGGTATGGVSDIAQQYVDQRADAETAGETTAKATQRPTQTRGGSTGYGTAAEYYRPGERVRPAQPSGVETLLESLRRVGPWLFVHLALLVCTIIAAVLLAVGGLTGDLSPVVAGVMAASMVTISLAVSATHVLTHISG